MQVSMSGLQLPGLYLFLFWLATGGHLNSQNKLLTHSMI